MLKNDSPVAQALFGVKQFLTQMSIELLWKARRKALFRVLEEKNNPALRERIPFTLP